MQVFSKVGKVKSCSISKKKDKAGTSQESLSEEKRQLCAGPRLACQPALEALSCWEVLSPAGSVTQPVYSLLFLGLWRPLISNRSGRARQALPRRDLLPPETRVVSSSVVQGAGRAGAVQQQKPLPASSFSVLWKFPGEQQETEYLTSPQGGAACPPTALSQPGFCEPWSRVGAAHGSSSCGGAPFPVPGCEWKCTQADPHVRTQFSPTTPGAQRWEHSVGLAWPFLLEFRCRGRSRE